MRLLVCRAAASDSLRWWDDNALTPDGAFVLGRLFPRSAASAARRLALEAARLRHAAAFEGLGQPRHLFDLGAEVEAALTEVGLDQPSVPDESIPDVAALLAHIGGMTGGQEVERQGAIVWMVVSELGGLREQALALAVAYAEGGLGMPVFPGVVEGQGG